MRERTLHAISACLGLFSAGMVALAAWETLPLRPRPAEAERVAATERTAVSSAPEQAVVILNEASRAEPKTGPLQVLTAPPAQRGQDGPAAAENAAPLAKTPPLEAQTPVAPSSDPVPAPVSAPGSTPVAPSSALVPTPVTAVEASAPQAIAEAAGPSSRAGDFTGNAGGMDASPRASLASPAAAGSEPQAPPAARRLAAIELGNGPEHTGTAATRHAEPRTAPRARAAVRASSRAQVQRRTARATRAEARWRRMHASRAHARVQMRAEARRGARRWQRLRPARRAAVWYGDRYERRYFDPRIPPNAKIIIVAPPRYWRR